MSIKTWEDTVSFILKLRGNVSKALDFFGGEPLINPEMFMKYVKILKKSGYKGRIRITTNGTIMSKKLYEFLKKNDIFVVLSFDGRDQDRFRGKSKKIIKNLKYLVPLVRYVNYVVADPKSFLKNLEYIWSLGFNVVNDIDLMGRNKKINNKIFETYKKQYETALNIMITSFNEGGKYLVASSSLSAISKNYLKPVCGLHKNSICIGADGKIYPCHRFVELGLRFAVGDVSNGVEKNRLKNIRAIKSGYCVVRSYQKYHRICNITPNYINKFRKIRAEIANKYKKDIIRIKNDLYGQ